MTHARRLSVLVAVSLATLVACNARINSPIEVPDGETQTGSLSTVNGSISVGKGATVEGACRTVNGSINVGGHSRVESLATVNGSIRTSADVEVEEVESVNGRIEMAGTTVGLDVETVHGGIRLTDGSVVKGDIVVKRAGGSGSSRTTPLEIELYGGSVVEGNVLVESQIEVHLILREGSRVAGRVENAEIIAAPAGAE